MRILINFTMLVTFGLFFSGCNDKVECAELLGTFIADTGHSRDIIETRGDGTYTHSYRIDLKGPEIISRNKWTCEIEGGSTQVTFEKFEFGIDFFFTVRRKHEPRISGFWIAHAEKSFGRIRLLINSDLGAYYVKK